MTTIISDREQKLIDAVAVHEQWQTITVQRESDREFDLSIGGTHTQFETPCYFRARLMLAALHSCCKWTSPGVAAMTDYPDMAMDGDWSAVRDSSDDTQWRIFNIHIEPHIGVIATTAKILKKMRKAKNKWQGHNIDRSIGEHAESIGLKCICTGGGQDYVYRRFDCGVEATLTSCKHGGSPDTMHEPCSVVLRMGALGDSSGPWLEISFDNATVAMDWMAQSRIASCSNH